MPSRGRTAACAEEGEDGGGDARGRAAGTSHLADLLAPDCVETARDHVRLDGRYARTLALTGYPRHVVLGWLDALTSAPEVADLSLHLVPQDTGAAQRVLQRRMVQLESSRHAGLRTGRLDDPQRAVAYADCARLQAGLQRGEQGVLSASLAITVYAATLEELEARTARVETAIGQLQGQSRRATWRAHAGFTSTLPAARDELRALRTLDTRSLATLFPFTSPGLAMEDGVLWGINTANTTPVLVNPFARELPNANCAVVAKSGAGKSYTVKLDLLRVLPRGVHALVIDPEDEYSRLAAAVGGQVVRLGPGSPHRLNPFDLPLPAAPAEDGAAGAEGDVQEGNAQEGNAQEGEEGAWDVLAAHIAGLHGLFDVLLAGEGARLSPREKGLLERALFACYSGAGITADPATHHRPPPTLPDLHRALATVDAAQSLADRLERYCTGAHARLFAGPTTVRLAHPLVVFSLAGLDDRIEPEVRTAAMLLIGQHIWQLARRDRRQPRKLVVDEAHVLTRYPAGDRFLEDVARRARKYGLGLTALTQDVGDFARTGAGRAILVNSGLRLLLWQDESTLGALEDLLRLTPAERTLLLARPRGEGLLLLPGGRRVPLRVEASPEEHALCHTDAADQRPLPPGVVGPAERPAAGAQPAQGRPAARRTRARGRAAS